VHYVVVMNRIALVAIATVALSAFAGCSASTEESVDDGTEQSEDALTQAERDERNMKRIREAVKDVEQEKVTFGVRTKAPSMSAGSGHRSEHASLYGVDWFQKWSGGVSADHDWSKGTEFGKRCMWASTLRFEAIMKEAPQELIAFLGEYDAWSGNFYNWVDDYSGKGEDGSEAFGDASGARLWAWRTGLSKWISQAAKDGSCYLPTKKMVVDYVAACKAHQASNDGQMQGCQASSR
jgi:hypothetical protein